MNGSIHEERAVGDRKQEKTGSVDVKPSSADVAGASWAPPSGSYSALLQRKIARRLQRGASGVEGNAGAAVERAAEGGGNPLGGDQRARFEGALGADLGGVRIHTGGE